LCNQWRKSLAAESLAPLAGWPAGVIIQLWRPGVNIGLLAHHLRKLAELSAALKSENKSINEKKTFAATKAWRAASEGSCNLLWP
jgi:hypothetical protein